MLLIGHCRGVAQFRGCVASCLLVRLVNMGLGWE
jgi:hypothetical protein